MLVMLVFSPAEVIFAGVGILPSVRIPPPFRTRHCNFYAAQAVSDVRSGQETLIDIFER